MIELIDEKPFENVLKCVPVIVKKMLSRGFEGTRAKRKEEASAVYIA